MKKSRFIALLTLIVAFVASLTLSACVNVDALPPVQSGSESSSLERVDTTAPVITVEGEKEYLVKPGEAFRLPKITAQDDIDAELASSIDVTFAGEAVELKDYTFICENSGTYTVNVSVSDTSGNIANEAILVHVYGENEINTFDNAVRLNNVTGKGITNLSLNTDPAFVRYGEGSLKVEVLQHTNVTWPGIIVSDLPIEDISDYYSISFWVYNDGTEDITIFLQRNEVNNSAKFNLPAKSWTKVEVKARDFDNVFQSMAKSGAEPEVGSCEDLKCFTFHFENKANVPTFNLYVDHIVVNTEAVLDVIGIEAEITHPIVGCEFQMPVPTVSYGGEEVEAEISYILYDESFNEIEFSGNSYTFAKAGKYVLSIIAEYDGVTASKNFNLICASERAVNEIEFFEEEVALNFFKSPHLKLTITEKEHHSLNDSTASLMIHSSPSVWPYINLTDLPYSDLEDIAYIYFYAKTDYALKDGQKAYLGLRDGKQGKVLKRFTLTNDWVCYGLTKVELAELGITTLQGLQISVEFYDLSNPANQGGWCPIAFNSYIDNFTAAFVEEPTQKAENVVLDFANYRDLDDVHSSYTSYNFQQLEYTLNNKGSLKVSCSGKWPTLKLGSSFEKFSLEGVKNLVVDVLVPSVASGHYVRVGANDSHYQKVYAEDAGKWVSLYIPVEALLKSGNTLANLEMNFARNDGTDWINLNTIYIGQIRLDYEGKPVEKHEFTGSETKDDVYMFTVKNSSYDVFLNTESAFVKDGNASIKLSAVPQWPQYYFSQEFIDWLKEKGYESISFELYIDDAGSEANVVMMEGAVTKYEVDKWFSVTLKVANLTTDTRLQFNKNKASALNVYLDNMQFHEPVLDYTGAETAHDLTMFSVKNDLYTVTLNSDSAFVKEGSNSIKLSAVPQWPQYFFTQEFIDWLKEKGYESISFDLYIDDAGSEANVVMMEGAVTKYEVDKWFSVTLKVANLTTNTKLQFNKNTAKALNVYIDNMQFHEPVLDYTGAETAHDLTMFSVKNDLYTVTLNSDSAFVKEGSNSIKLSAVPQWPQYFFTQEFIDWLKEKGYESISFDLYIDDAGSEANVVMMEGAVTKYEVDKWFSVTLKVANLTTNTKLQFNKNTAKALNVYLDNMQFSAHSHNYTSVVTDPTCTEAGFTTHTCSCGDSYTDTPVVALGHTAGAEASCTTAQTCTVCGVQLAPALGHNPGAEATCDNAQTCTVCGVQLAPALGHSWNTTLSHDASGHWYDCSVCGSKKDLSAHDFSNGDCVCGEEKPECNHSWNEANCTTPKTCSICGETTGEALGHSWQDATCTTPKTCTTCGAIEGEALGHSWDEATCTNPKTCSTCGLTEGEALGHSWQDATCTTPKTCSICGATEGEALGHNFGDAETECDLAMFSVQNTAYTVSLNTNAQFVKSGNASLKLSAVPQWPQYFFTQEYIDWLKKNGYTYISFELFVDDATNNLITMQGAYYAPFAMRNEWFTVVLKVSDLNTTKPIQFNKNRPENMDAYLDNIKFYTSLPTEFSGDAETLKDLDMFRVVDAGAVVSLNTNAQFIKEGSASIKLSAEARWPQYFFTDEYIAWLKANNYISVSFDIYIDSASSATTVSAMEGSITRFELDKWFTVTLSVASLESNNKIQFNKDAVAPLSAYVDNFQYAEEVKDFTDAETERDLDMFRVQYGEALTLSTDFVKDGSYSIKMTATPRWPAYFFTQEYIDWLNANEVDYISFFLYIDQAGSATKVYAMEGAVTSYVVDKWFNVTLKVSSLTTSTMLQFDKNEAASLSVYLDDISYIKGEELVDENEFTDIAMFSVQNTKYEIGDNFDSTFVIAGKYSIKFTAIDRWPQYFFTQEYIDWLKANNVEKISFKLYIDAANSETTVTAMEGAVTKFSLDQWFSVTLEVSKLTTKSRLQVNKPAVKSLSFYLDDLQFVYHVHSYQSVVTKPTCTEAGFTTHTCSCGDSYTDTPVVALGHTAGAEASCTTAQTCSVCGVQLVPALGHNPGAEATCDNAQVCLTCGAVLNPALGHSWSATLSHDASGHWYDCLVCGGKKDLSAHDFSNGDCVCGEESPECKHVWNDATCTTAKTCSICGETTGEALGHSWNEANCTTAKTCSICGATEGEALGHSWNEANCTTPKTCSICGATEGEALGHSWNEANCTTPKTCSICGVTEGEALGHSWQDATCTTPKTCSICGATEGEALGHNYGSGESECDLAIFRVQYGEALTLSSNFVREGSYAIKMTATPRWPAYFFTQDYIDWLNENGYETVSFDLYIDQANSATAVYAMEGVVTNYVVDKWFNVTLKVANITTSSMLQFDKNEAASLSVYLDNIQYFTAEDVFHGEENITDLKMFSVKNTAYTVSVNADTAFIREGLYSLKLSAEPQWPQYYFTQEFIDWLNANGYTSLSFDLYIDNAGSSVNVIGMEGTVTSYSLDKWFNVNLKVSSLTTSSMLQFNRDAVGALNVYLDNLQFIKSGLPFLGDETASELRMFSVTNTDYKMSVNYDLAYVAEGTSSLKFTATPRWPAYFFTQEFIDWLKANNIEKISFKLYIDAESSATTVTKTEGVYAKSSPALNSWISVTVAVSKLTTSSKIQVNKSAAKSLSFYLDDMQFIYHSHSYKAVVTAPTCTEEGFTTHTCSCGDSYTDTIVASLGGHTAGAEATCTTAQICTVCGVQLAPALGHTEVIDGAKAPTCKETGLTEGKHCSVCNEVLVKQESVAIIDHILDNNVCTMCGLHIYDGVILDGAIDSVYGEVATVAEYNEGRNITLRGAKTANGVVLHVVAVMNSIVNNAAEWHLNTNLEFRLNCGPQRYVNVKGENFGVKDFVWETITNADGKYIFTVELFVEADSIQTWATSEEIQVNYAWKAPGDTAYVRGNYVNFWAYRDKWTGDWFASHLGGLDIGANDFTVGLDNYGLWADNLRLTEEGLKIGYDASEAVIDGNLEEYSELASYTGEHQDDSSLTLSGKAGSDGLYLAITITHASRSAFNANEWWNNDNLEFNINEMYNQQNIVLIKEGKLVHSAYWDKAAMITTGEEGNYTTTIELFAAGVAKVYKVFVGINGTGFNGWQPLGRDVYITPTGVALDAPIYSAQANLDGVLDDAIWTEEVLAKSHTTSANGAEVTMVGVSSDYGVHMAFTVKHAKALDVACQNDGTQWWHYMGAEVRLGGVHYNQIAFTAWNNTAINCSMGYTSSTNEDGTYTTVFEIFVPYHVFQGSGNRVAVIVGGVFENGFTRLWGAYNWTQKNHDHTTHYITPNGIIVAEQ